MTNTWKSIVVLALVIAVGAAALHFYPALGNSGSTASIAGATPGDLPAENYDPYIRYNGGFYSNLPMQIANTLTVSVGQTFTGGAVFGAMGDTLNQANFGFCNLKPSITTIAASSTVAVDCGGSANGSTALNGVIAGSVVQLQFSTTTPTTFEGIGIQGVSASSTSGFITALVYNGTGATFTWTAAATSSLQYEVVR